MKLEFLATGSSDCPSIRLYEFSWAEAQNLRELVKSLSNGSEKSVALDEQPGIESVQGCHLTLRPGEREQGVHQAGPSRFECILSSIGWGNMDGLLEPFCESDSAGF
jgi:hypothetical protein